MRLAPRISLLAALVCGLLAALLARGLMQGGPDLSLSRTIVIARTAVPPGSPLTRDNLREVPWRAAEPLDGSFAHIDDLVREGRRLTLASLRRNEPVLASRITAPNQRATLSTQLDDGMRAVAVRVDEVRGVAGFVLPGDRVDIVLTRGENATGGDQAFADMLLQNAKVLAVDQIATEGQDKPTVARAVTLELTQEQAQKVVLAQGIGRLSLILRQSGESGNDVAKRVSVSDLGPDASADRDRVAELKKQIDDMKRADDAARAEAERHAARQLAEMEARMRGEFGRPAMNLGAPPPPKAAPPSSVVNVIRNGSKTEQYTVAAER